MYTPIPDDRMLITVFRGTHGKGNERCVIRLRHTCNQTLNAVCVASSRDQRSREFSLVELCLLCSSSLVVLRYERGNALILFFSFFFFSFEVVKIDFAHANDMIFEPFVQVIVNVL